MTEVMVSMVAGSKSSSEDSTGDYSETSHGAAEKSQDHDRRR